MHSREEVRRFLLEDRLKLATVSGVLTTRPGLIDWADRDLVEIEVITTKSYQVRPNCGNREPVLVEASPGCYGNAVGLRNPGMEEGLRELQALRATRPLRALLNVSLSADNPHDFAVLARRFQAVADLLELNFSCPHASNGYGSAIGSDPRAVRLFTAEARASTSAPLFVKLTPNVLDIARIAREAVRAGADGISAINTVGPELFREPLTGTAVLNNPPSHRGGKSGTWILEKALEAVREIRQELGKAVPILGMGGVATGDDARRMREAGANAVGIGSAFIRIRSQAEIPAYLRVLKHDAETGTRETAGFLSMEFLMRYRAFRIRRIRAAGPDLRVFTLEGSLEACPSQYVFLFLPGVGEKPFSVARIDPLTFIIRRRGPFTSALFDCKPGEPILVRGPYGAAAPSSPCRTAFVVSGGSGLAVAGILAEHLRRQGKLISLFHGAAAPQEAALASFLEEYRPPLPVTTVVDEGRQGRILLGLERSLREENPAELACYTIGPLGFLKAAAEVQSACGLDPKAIFLCFEPESLCGVGACGQCECGGSLLCKEGTFVSLRYLLDKGIGMIDHCSPQPALPLVP